MANNVQTPRPTPQFYPDPCQHEFSTKGRAKTARQMIPRAMRSAPMVNRMVDRRFANQRAHAVTFKHGEEDGVDESGTLHCAYYDENRSEAYIEQCFIIRSRLGVGSFGQVFHVTSKEDGRDYAIKCALNIFKSDADRHAKLGEVQKHEQIPAHTNLVGFVRAWEERGRLYIQTELCSTTLDEVASTTHPVPERRLWRYVVDLLLVRSPTIMTILQALKHLHAHKLVHTDVKPENIFLSSDDIVKLGDFGLVTDLSNGTPTDYPEGDCKYLAPELLDGHLSTSADIFSLGASLLELATDLDMPSSGPAWSMLRSNRLPTEYMQNLSPSMRSLIEAMMQSSPLLRPSAETLLRNATVGASLYSRRAYHMYRSVVNMGGSVWQTMYFYLGSWMLLIYVSLASMHGRLLSFQPYNDYSQRPPEQQVTPLHHERAVTLTDSFASIAPDEHVFPRTELADRHRNISTGSRHLLPMPPKVLLFDDGSADDDDDEMDMSRDVILPSPRLPMRGQAPAIPNHRALFRNRMNLSPIVAGSSVSSSTERTGSPLAGSLLRSPLREAVVHGPRQSTPRQQCRSRPAPMTTPRVRLRASENRAVYANTVNVAHVKPMRRTARLVESQGSGVLQPLKKRRLLWQGGRPSADRGDEGHSPPSVPDRAMGTPESLSPHPMVLRSTPTRQHRHSPMQGTVFLHGYGILDVLNMSYSRSRPLSPLVDEYKFM